MAVQVSGELCEKCGWAMKFPEEPCRCELLAEVERLTRLLQVRTRERDDYYGANLLAKEARDEALAEVERMKGDRSEVNTAKLNESFTEGTLAAGDAIRPKIADAFNRGIQAGREQVISYLGLQAAVFAVNVEQMQKNIRTMQFPVDT